MSYSIDDCRTLENDPLIERLKSLCEDERSALADILAHLAVLDERDAVQRKAFPSLWVYCRKELRYSEDAATYRIAAARAVSRFPTILGMIRDGRISLTAVARLSSHLSKENHESILGRACGATRNEIEAMIASFSPREERRDRIQVISVVPPAPPTPQTMGPADLPLLAAAASSPLAAAASFPPDGDQPPAPLPPATDPAPPAPPAVTRVYFSFTGSLELRKKVDRAAQILWHSFPDGRLEDLVSAALDDLLERRDPDRKKERQAAARTAAKSEPGKRSRSIPVWVRTIVWKRDQGCCAFTTNDGVRCGERSGLQYDHVIPFALGGPSDDPSNIRLLCFAHNQMLARHAFGDDWRTEGEAAASPES